MGILIGTPKKTPRKGEISRCLLIIFWKFIYGILLIGSKAYKILPTI
ncbi:hypothetical protein HMPREF1867_01872 [Veillonella dispar]|nr:hypothetical protein HMPREF1867_01872 [Veillonella dispar]